MLHSPRRQRGLSLVELMVSITLGLFLALAVIQVFLSTRGVFRTQDSMSVLQENGRFALGFLIEDIRMTGFMGCARSSKLAVKNHLGSAAATFSFAPGDFIVGGNNVAATNAWGALQGTDAVTVRRAKAPGVRLNGKFAGASITVVGASTAIDTGDVIMISDCLNADIVSVTGKTGVNLTLNHALSKPYGFDAEVFPVDVTQYFIDRAKTSGGTNRTTASGKNINSLYVRHLTTVAHATTAPAATELVEGVESMQLEYGEDTDGDYAANAYRFTSANPTTPAPNYSNVVSVRINLLLQAIEDNVAMGDQAQSISFMGTDIDADGRLRQVFSSTTSLRNRIP